MTEFTWRKSRRSGQNNSCVELAVTPDATHVRDSKNTMSGSIHLDGSGWTAFLDAVKADRLG